MHELLFQHFDRLVPVTEAEFAPLAALLTARSLGKKEVLLRPGEVCKTLNFVAAGVLRAFTTDAKGVEFTDQFAFEGWWASDLYSFLTGEPGSYTIEALESSRVLQLSHHGVQHLLATMPLFERYFRLLLQNNYIATHRRLNLALSRPAEDTYDALLATHPTIMQRVPQHMVASYLGITPEFLSRLRGRKLRGKS